MKKIISYYYYFKYVILTIILIMDKIDFLYFIISCSLLTKQDAETITLSCTSLPNTIISSSSVISCLFCSYYLCLFYPRTITNCCLIVSFIILFGFFFYPSLFLIPLLFLYFTITFFFLPIRFFSNWLD
jgi:hypothetical protein